MPNFTTENLLIYLYDDMEPEEVKEVESALESDWVLQQKYSVLSEAQDRLNETPLYSPRASTIHNILNYAESGVHHSN